MTIVVAVYPNAGAKLQYIFRALPFYALQETMDFLINIMRLNQQCPNSREERENACQSANLCCGRLLVK